MVSSFGITPASVIVRNGVAGSVRSGQARITLHKATTRYVACQPGDVLSWKRNDSNTRDARAEIERVFAYRHRVTTTDTAWHYRYGGRAMNIAITGASGLIGSALAPFLRGGGHTVVAVPRGRPSGAGPCWDPATGELSAVAAEGFNAVIHLAGENIAGGRWSDARKRRIRQSRADGTRGLSEALARLPVKPSTLIVASAIGFYGDRGDQRVDETSTPGEGFLPEVCEAWESAADPARQAGIRVIHLRFGIVLTPAGGALGQMLLPFKMGVGGVLGSGRQHMSWVAIDDVLGSILHVLRTESVVGAGQCRQPERGDEPGLHQDAGEGDPPSDLPGDAGVRGPTRVRRNGGCPAALKHERRSHSASRDGLRVRLSESRRCAAACAGCQGWLICSREVAELLGLDRATALTVLQTLEDSDFLKLTPDGQFRGRFPGRLLSIRSVLALAINCHVREFSCRIPPNGRHHTTSPSICSPHS